MPNSDNIVCIAFDVVAPYPSLNARESGKIFGQEPAKSDIYLYDINYLELARYLSPCCEPWELQQMGVSKLVHTRTKITGSRPDITGEQMVLGKSNNWGKWFSWFF